MKLTLLLLASVGSYLLASFLLFLGLHVLEMNQWQGTALGISMWTLLIAGLALFAVAVWGGVSAFRNRKGTTLPD